MKRSRLKGNGMFVYGGAAIITIVVAAGLRWGFKTDSFIYGFLFRCWPIQFLSSWLFMIGLFCWIQRYSLFKKEDEVLQKIRLPEFSIYHGDASQLIRNMPEEHKKTLTLRRFRELLQAFLYGEDLIRLNEELSRRDLADVEKGHLILNSVRNIIPIIGFLGTVIGLSLGIVEFPNTTDVTALRTALKEFAASLSVAFDTTLLALGYTVVITLLIAYLRGREESLVGEVDDRARALLGEIRYGKKGISVSGKGKDREAVSVQNPELAKEIGKAVGENLEVLVQKMEDMRKELQRPPRYQVIVQPARGEKDEE